MIFPTGPHAPDLSRDADPVTVCAGAVLMRDHGARKPYQITPGNRHKAGSRSCFEAPQPAGNKRCRGGPPTSGVLYSANCGETGAFSRGAA